jgi:hypothetical protein
MNATRISAAAVNLGRGADEVLVAGSGLIFDAFGKPGQHDDAAAEIFVQGEWRQAGRFTTDGNLTPASGAMVLLSPGRALLACGLDWGVSPPLAREAFLYEAAGDPPR